MKKIFVSLLLSSIAICHVNGQMALTGNKFADNWSVGINAVESAKPPVRTFKTK